MKQRTIRDDVKTPLARCLLRGDQPEPHQEADNERVLAAVVMTTVSLSLVRSQTQIIGEDCACEAQVLPATLAVVNGVTISARDVEKATGESIRKLKQQVVDARKRELDLMINSKLLAIEAKKRGVTTTKLLEQEVIVKVTPPTQAEARTFYD